MTIPLGTTAASIPPVEGAPRDTFAAMKHGARGRCPACGKGRLFASYLKVADQCPACGTALHHHRTDDAGIWATMLIVCHIVVGGLLWSEKKFAPDTMTHLLVWLPVATILTVGLLPIAKGAFVGLQWAHRMHGFGTGPDPSGPDPEPQPAKLKPGARDL
jgi:uncharacterized protein (DUF983 family)